MSRYSSQLISSCVSTIFEPEAQVRVKSLETREPFPSDSECAKLWCYNRKIAGNIGRVINRIVIVDNYCDPLVLHEDGTEAIYKDSELEYVVSPVDPAIEKLNEFLNAKTIYQYEELNQTTEEIKILLQKNFNIGTVARLLAEYEHTRRRCKQLTGIYPFVGRVLSFTDPIPRLSK